MNTNADRTTTVTSGGILGDEVDGSVRESSSSPSTTDESNGEAGDTDIMGTPSSQQPPQTPVAYLHRSMELDINTPVYLRGTGGGCKGFDNEEE